MTARPGYDQHATARLVAEPAKRAVAAGVDVGRFPRSPFERDRARVLHTSALRRLAAKTQVVAVDAGDFPRTRLTHSLECAQIGRELGAALGCDPDLVDAACLAHDLGHPPFGHNGEAALAEVAAPCGGFEGNAQSLRLLTRLEPKVPGAGLNLTRATLDATLKYPWLAGGGLAKYGAYAADAEAFAWIRDRASAEGHPCVEAQVMDWADDVAYSVHDLEDGLHAGLITLDALADPAERPAVVKLTAAEYCAPGSVTEAELAGVFDGLLALPCWPSGYDAGPFGLAALKNLTSELIGRLCGAAHSATLAASGGQPVTRYTADLAVPRRQRLECALLKGVTAHFVMSRAGAAEAQARERELVTELAAAVRIGAPGTLDPSLRAAYEAAGTDPARLRVVVDQVASLTDTSAVAWHARLCR
ncbi:MAG TPA: deoxyguanosinetriphosphate triphosphohydrolase [Streptosporangiaceae bacterium]|nr:deoxyguanosinetriphosphate triphosphohydrolase [Streptosporangiaceae bacterium]